MYIDLTPNDVYFVANVSNLCAVPSCADRIELYFYPWVASPNYIRLTSFHIVKDAWNNKDDLVHFSSPDTELTKMPLSEVRFVRIYWLNKED